MTENGLQVQSSLLKNNLDPSHKAISSTSVLPSPPFMDLATKERMRPEIPQDTALESEFGASISAPEHYSSSKYLIPKYWLPFIYSSESGYGTQVSTSAFDPLEKHSYSLQAGYDSYAHKSNFLISYGNTTTTWPMIFSYMKEDRTPPLLDFSYDINEINFLATHRPSPPQ